MTQKTPTVPEHIKPAPIREEQPPRQPEGPKKSSGKGWIWFLVLILAAAAAYYFYSKGTFTEAGTTSSEGGKSGGKKGGGLAPVVAVKATRGNIGVYIDDPGLIVPIYTELVKSRVDGQLMAIHYNEGDLIQKGHRWWKSTTAPSRWRWSRRKGKWPATRRCWTMPGWIWRAIRRCWPRTPFPSSNWPPRRPW